MIRPNTVNLNRHQGDTMQNTNGRRSFMKSAMFTGAAALSGTSANAIQSPDPDKRLKIGVIGIGDYSFMTYCWSDIIEGTSEANSKHGNFGTPFLNMDITHVWDVNTEAAADFARRMNAEVVKTYDGMVGKIDGLIFAGFYEVPWQHRLARPYIEAGIPVYLSRPFAYRLRDIDTVLDLAAKHNTPILATAKHEHYNEAPSLKKKLSHIGPIQCVHATCWSADYPVHFHTMYMLLRIFGYDVNSVSVIMDSDFKTTYLQDTYIFKGWENQPPFTCTLSKVQNEDSFSVTIVGKEDTVSATMLRSPDWRDSLLFRYAPQVIAMQRTFYGEQFEPLDNIRKKTEIFLTGYYSHLEANGAPVPIGTVSPDWMAPPVKPDWISESIF